MNALKARIKKQGYSIRTFSRLVGMNTSTFYRKIKNNSFDIKEARRISLLLQLTSEEFEIIFFGSIVA